MKRYSYQEIEQRSKPSPPITFGSANLYLALADGTFVSLAEVVEELSQRVELLEKKAGGAAKP